MKHFPDHKGGRESSKIRLMLIITPASAVYNGVVEGLVLGGTLHMKQLWRVLGLAAATVPSSCCWLAGSSPSLLVSVATTTEATQ